MNNIAKRVLMVLLVLLVSAFILFLILAFSLPARNVLIRVAGARGVSVLATITAYTSSPDETDDTPFITASGAHVSRGTLACPPKYNFGAQFDIEGKLYVCEDRMNRRYHHQERFDVWVEGKEEAYKWGAKKLEITLLAE